MQYFKILPKIVYNNPITNTPIIMTDLLARASIIPSILKNPLIYYQYDIQDGDTPETVAYKYYGDQYRYWLILFANQILDPQWNWPLDYQEFNAYLTDKYNLNMDTNNPNPYVDIYGTVYQYQKTITQLEIDTKTTTTNTVAISEEEYNSFIPSSVIYNVPTSIPNVTTDVQVTITSNALSIYDWENAQNESKRTINIINSTYATQIESEFKKLMAK